MTPQQQANKIAELEQWLRDNPNHENRTIIEKDLRKLREQSTQDPTSETHSICENIIFTTYE